MPGDTSRSYRSCEYLKCKPNVFSTWVYVAIIIKPSPPPHPLYLFIQRLFASIIELFNPLFSTSVVNPPLNDLLRLVSFTTSTPSGINLPSWFWTFSKASWNPSYVYIDYSHPLPFSILWNPTLLSPIIFHQNIQTTFPPISLFRFLSQSHPLIATYANFSPYLPLTSILRWPSHVTGSFSALFLPETSTFHPMRQVKPRLPLNLPKTQSIMLPTDKLPSSKTHNFSFFPSILSTMLTTNPWPPY